jgi:large subunit ribosomal protein L30
MAAFLVVTQVKSSIGTKPKHRGALRALGLHGIGTSNTLPDRPEVRGMIARVPHLIRVDETPAGAGGVAVSPGSTVTAAED